MSQKIETNHQAIADWAGDIVALVSHVEEALDHQLKLHTGDSSSAMLIRELHDTVRDDKKRAEAFQESIGSTAGNPVIKVGSEFLGKAAGVIDRMRKDSVAKSLRDDYTAMNHVAIAYTMLHTTGMALKHEAATAFASTGMHTYAGLVQKINHVIPDAVISDLVDNGDVAVVDPSVADDCRAEIDRAWQDGDA